MARIAQLMVECPECSKRTNIFVEESPSDRAKVRCEHCKAVFEFGAGMMYKPIAYVAKIPRSGRV